MSNRFHSPTHPGFKAVQQRTREEQRRLEMAQRDTDEDDIRVRVGRVRRGGFRRRGGY